MSQFSFLSNIVGNGLLFLATLGTKPVFVTGGGWSAFTSASCSCSKVWKDHQRLPNQSGSKLELPFLCLRLFFIASADTLRLPLLLPSVTIGVSSRAIAGQKHPEHRSRTWLDGWIRCVPKQINLLAHFIYLKVFQSCFASKFSQ